jgi:ubiquinone/menaquinone biosynthesis C-methylase UbiE
VSRGEWEPEAENWVRWARTPQHDAYWFYRDVFFDQLLPLPGLGTIEIGCGEGRVGRDLAARGHRVVGIDSSLTLLQHASTASAETSYALADGAALPFADGCFDLAVAYNSLQVVADMQGTVAEATRVLRPGGHFCLCVSHPVTDMGRIVGQEPEVDFAIRRDYFGNRRVDDVVEEGGHAMTFRGWTHSLEDYAMALEGAGLRIEAMREPRPSDASERFRQWQRVPLFLLVRAVKT